MLAMIAAIDSNNGIGKDNKLLVHIKEDLQYFKKVTENNVIVMGYNTWESLPKKPLPNRENYVLTSKNIVLDDANVISSTDEILELTEKYPDKTVFIIGGASLYKQMIKEVDKLYITKIMEEFEADTFFPEITNEWKIEKILGDASNLNHKHPHIFMIYKRKKMEDL